jgi:Ca-activated chloride channel homolog
MNLTFLYPQTLILLLFLPLALLLVRWRWRAYQRTLSQLGDQHLIAALIPRLNVRTYSVQALVWMLALTALIIANARPVWGTNIDVIEIQGVSVVLVLDVSNSMAAEDVRPNRLVRAKLALQDLLEQLEGNQVGVVVFAGTAIVLFPLTTDMHSAEVFLNSVDTKAITQQGTAIAEALDAALGMFDKPESGGTYCHTGE